MKQVILFSILTFTALFSQGALYKCYASKFPSDVQHAFADGYVLLSIIGTMASLKFYYINTVAKETTVEFSAIYSLGQLVGGQGKIKDFVVGSVQSATSEDVISTVYFEQTLMPDDKNKSGIVGKFAFSGHAYTYDWNVCYNDK